MARSILYPHTLVIAHLYRREVDKRALLAIIEAGHGYGLLVGHYWLHDMSNGSGVAQVTPFHFAGPR